MSEDLREQVKKHYGEIAGKVQTGGSSCCCGTSCCSSVVNPSLFYESDYLKGLPKEAVAASLGCANPLVLADLKEGETVRGYHNYSFPVSTSLANSSGSPSARIASATVSES